LPQDEDMAKVLLGIFSTTDPKQKHMKFCITTGRKEKHAVEVQFNQLLGTLSIRANGTEIVKYQRWFSEPLKEAHQFEVGQDETWSFKIEKERRDIFTSTYRVFVNNRLAGFYQGA